MIGIIADKSGKVHYKNLLGYADVEAKTADQRRQRLLDRFDDEDVCRRVHHDAGG